ncbi:MAG: hypothetical protein AB8G15_18540 [Saprospiraceae bacterium]
MKLLLTILLSTIYSLGFSQMQNDFEELVARTNRYLQSYESLNGFASQENYFAWKDTHLPTALVESMRKDQDYQDELSPSRDSISEYGLILELQALIFQTLGQVLAHPVSQGKDFTALFSEGDLAVIRSDDGKLYNFSLDEKTGGTYRSRISLMHFIDFDAQQRPSAKAIENGASNPYAIFEGDGFDRIYAIESKEGIKYLLEGSVRGCSTCFESNIMLVSRKMDGFEQDFAYAVSSRGWESSISYDHETKTISIDYLTDDLTSSCYCSEDGTEEDYSEESDLSPVKNCTCTFEFDGFSFELVQAGWKKVKME